MVFKRLPRNKKLFSPHRFIDVAKDEYLSPEQRWKQTGPKPVSATGSKIIENRSNEDSHNAKTVDPRSMEVDPC